MINQSTNRLGPTGISIYSGLARRTPMFSSLSKTTSAAVINTLKSCSIFWAGRRVLNQMGVLSFAENLIRFVKKTA